MLTITGGFPLNLGGNRIETSHLKAGALRLFFPIVELAGWNLPALNILLQFHSTCIPCPRLRSVFSNGVEPDSTSQSWILLLFPAMAATLTRTFAIHLAVPFPPEVSIWIFPS